MRKKKEYQSGLFNKKGLGGLIWTAFIFSVISITLVAQIAQPKVLRPGGGEVLNSGGQYTIQWANIRGSKVNINLVGHGMPAKKIAVRAANSGVFNWNISCSLQGKNFVLWVISADTASSARSAGFDILDPRRVTAPAAGAKVTAGATYAVQWRGIYGGNVRITLTKKNTNMTSHIALSTINRGTFKWRVPVNLEGEEFRLWIRDVSLPACAASSGYFSIRKSVGMSPVSMKGKRTMTTQAAPIQEIGGVKLLLRPKGNEVILAGSPYTIRWSGLKGGPGVRIILKKNDQFKANLALGASNTGVFTWNVGPAENGDNYRIRITGYPRNTSDFVASQSFSIVQPPRVTKPNRYFSVQPGKNFFINWRNFSSRNLVVELWRNGVLQEVIARSVPNNNTYEWGVAAHYFGYGFRIKIKSTTKSGEFAFSEKFKIME